MRDELYVGMGLFWTTDCQARAAAQGWELATREHRDGVKEHRILPSRKPGPGSNVFCSGREAHQFVMERAAAGDPLAALAAAFFRASYEDVSVPCCQSNWEGAEVYDGSHLFVAGD